MAWKGHNFGNKKRRSDIKRKWRRGAKQYLAQFGKKKAQKPAKGAA